MLARFLSRSQQSTTTPAMQQSSASLSRSVRGLRATRPDVQQAGKMTDIGARQLMTSDHDQFREMARRFFVDQVAPQHAEFEKAKQVSREIWQEAGKVGLLGVAAPEKYGGGGGDILHAAVVWEEQMYANVSGLGISLHSDICMPYLLKYGTPEQCERWLPQMCSGDLIAAIAMTEPGAGSDLQGVQTVATKSECGKYYTLNGSKTYITNGYMCDLVIVVAKTDVNVPGARGISLLMVEQGMDGFTKGEPLEKLGLKAQDTCELFFDDVQVPVENLIGQENAGFKMLMQELPQERLLIADQAASVAEASYEWTREWVNSRKAFGATLSKLQVVRHNLAKMKTDATVTRHFIDHCLALHQEGLLDPSTASMAKLVGSESQARCVDMGLQMHGGIGFCWESDIAKAFADARVSRIYGGSNEIMTELIARDI